MHLPKLHGAHVPHRKNTAGMRPERMPTPKMVSIPMSMHIGAPAEPLVKPGDQVKVGQLIAKAGGSCRPRSTPACLARSSASTMFSAAWVGS